MTDKNIDFYWDIGSTNTYFAFHLIKPIAAETGASISYIPFNLGYVFRHHNYALSDEPRAKLANRGRDLQRWAEKHELPFRVPDKFPIKTSRILRGALVAANHGLEDVYLKAIFSEYWERNNAAIESYAGLAPIVEALGLEGDRFQGECESEPVKQQLITLTQQALANGIFGAPTFVVGQEIFWGKDRLDFVRDQLLRQPAG
ncbi:MAG: 2-hydroxychromene-2-carboxylate isomerase [Pseudomonadales bacterium]|jgi:2-hydroxychromene-2-carboxylate isomerase|nr:2-hydroxychromene-2-carboxylate isomerase [Pseudomonadales bacterium]MDP7595339.1 2-hydroxychromene-2-carboxylate isomerase [Pseudomonadales bacterium]HJN53237.1 2-hydroxychromene-2-carboxylate isomerase [Pseudomonadales bacterium]|tara:strand:- start:1574 stop:2179 length:606 start_codon:yes stop_codon:yes gene_type:complete